MEIKRVNLTKENLKLIKSIDQTFYSDDVLTLDWYLERYNEKHFGYVLVDSDNKYIGYIVAVPIKKELYDAIINSVITNDLYFNPKMFIDNSEYFYISSILILEEYRGKGYGSKLVDCLLNELNNNKLCAITISEAGYNLVKNKMKLINKIADNNCIFIN